MNWGYIAGYFDADGNFHVKFNKSKPSFQLLIRIYSTQKIVLEKIKEFIGYGYVRIVKKKSNPKWSDCYEYCVSKKSESKDFIKRVIPYLIIKKTQGEFLLNNFDFRRTSNIDFDLEEFRKPITRKKNNTE